MLHNWNYRQATITRSRSLRVSNVGGSTDRRFVSNISILSVRKPGLDYLLKCDFVFFDPAKIVFGNFGFLAIHHAFVLLVQELGHTRDLFEHSATLLCVLRDHSTRGQVLMRDVLRTDMV